MSVFKNVAVDKISASVAHSPSNSILLSSRRSRAEWLLQIEHAGKTCNVKEKDIFE
jgi:hypothetical protein